MVSLIALVLATQVPVEQPPRLRTLLPNGSVVLVQHEPHARQLVVDLFISAKGVEESPSTHGRRHLLEHLVALGADGTLDRRLESVGGFLYTRTYRDCLAFELSLPPKQLEVGIKTVRELLAPLSVSEADIAREAHLIEEEGALQGPSVAAFRQVWTQGLGDRGLDPFGNIDVIRTTTPAQVRELQATAFTADHVLVAISGDVDLDATTAAATKMLSALPSGKGAKSKVPEVPKGIVVAPTGGDYRGIPVSGFRSPETAAALAAVLAVAAQVDDAEISYTPSALPGLLILGRREGTLDAVLAHANPASLFTTGKLMALRWLRSRLVEPSDETSFRGMLMVQERDLRPETMIENLESLPYRDFERALNLLRLKPSSEVR